MIPIVFAFTGCSDFLSLEPQDELIREEYWKTEGDVVAVLGATYGRMASLLDELYYWSELRGGLISPDEKRVSPTSLEFFDYNLNEYNDKIRWDDFYVVINLANTLIKYAPLAKENDQTFSDQAYNGYLAEAYYIRSLCYFYLVKAFRDVPFILEPYATDGQDFSIEKSDEKEILNQLITDLNGIVDQAFEADYFLTMDEKKGRVTRNAVYALLADLYLWNDEYASCIEACDQISDIYMVSGENYFSIFAQDGNSLESIFELQFDYDQYETTNNLYELTSNNTRADREFIVSEFLTGLFVGKDLRQFSPDGDATFNSSNLSIWKYEGNAPYEENSIVVHRTRETSDANWIFYRLPDIHLMKAEAYAETDNFSRSLEELNMVRDRAGIDKYLDTDKKKLLEEILDERAREFVGEGKRWFDLVRVSRRDISNRLSFIYEAVIANVNPQSRTAAATKIKDMDSWFLPVYYDELLLNRQLEQNPFYD
ncbi:MAG: RagB/SusD family nutrient uptake outer membrane protein [Bacteroidales bacterium]|nr:RagB/SusD family nutrient uptake outer membrane protein [Bacteroidales bacterium]